MAEAGSWRYGGRVNEEVDVQVERAEDAAVEISEGSIRGGAARVQCGGVAIAMWEKLTRLF